MYVKRDTRRAWPWPCLLGATALLLASCGAFSSSDDAAAPVDGGGGTVIGDAADGAATSPHDGGALGPCSRDLSVGWKPPQRLTQLRGGGGELGFVDPFVTSDGLTLFVVNASGSPLRIFRATRASRDAEWSAAVALSGVSNETYAPPYLSSAKPSEEVIIAAEGSQTDIFEVLPSGDGWSKEKIPSLFRPDVDLWPTLSADGLVVVYEEVNANKDNPFRALFQASRSAPSPSADWSEPKGLASPPYDGGPGDVAWSHPALTPDALGLFYSVDTERGAVRVAQRKTREDAFFSATQSGTLVPSLGSDGYTTRVRSVTADGCEAYLTSDRDGVLDSYVATRTP